MGTSLHELNVEAKLHEQTALMRKQLQEMQKREPAYAKVEKAKRVLNKFDYFMFGAIFATVTQFILRCTIWQ